jgi:tetratricopeptide (TPR) repeat protein
MTAPGNLKSAASNFNSAVRPGVSIAKHAARVCVSRFGVPRNALAVLLILHSAFWVASGSAVKAKGTSEADHVDSQIADLYHAGKYQEAIPLARRLVENSEKKNGPDHPETAGNLENLAVLYMKMGDYPNAETLLQRALAIYERALGSDHPDTAKGVNNLAELYELMGDYAKAEPLLQRALAIKEKALGPDDPSTASGLLNLGLLYFELGDYAKAEPLMRRALAINEKALGPDDPSTAESLNSLGLLYMRTRDYAKSEPLLRRALVIEEKALGRDHPNTAHGLNNLAELYEATGDYAKAESLYRRALAINERAFGSGHPSTTESLNNLAELYGDAGDYAKAEPLLRRAAAINEKTLGPDHPDTASSLHNLAFSEIDLGKVASALEFAERAEKTNERLLGNILSFTSEQQRLAFQDTTNPFTLFATLGSAPDIAQAILHNKGVVLDSLVEDRLVAEASKDAKQREVIDQVRMAKQRYTQLLMEVPRDYSAEASQRREAELEKRAAQVENLEATLARQVSGLGRARSALSVTVGQVQGALAGDQALVELLWYPHYLGKNKWETRYGAVMIASKGGPVWIPLGAADKIEESTELYRKSVRGNTDETTLHTVLRTLHDQVWTPIEKALPAGTRTIILSPDGELNFVSFGTLLTSGAEEFLIEKYSIRYVASGRDLIRKREASATQLLAAFGNPDYGGEAKSVTQQTQTTDLPAMRATEMGDFGKMALTPLPGTQEECAGLKAKAEASGLPNRIFLGPEATKAQLREINSPRILHLATHGFFLPESEDEQRGNDRQLGNGGTNPILKTQEGRKTPVILNNPMHRSGFALAGAQRTLEAWAKGEVPPRDNDGIVTAEEVGGLNLKGTWLAVLSACDTGTGEAKAGEGVLGLRRGFVEAGCQNLSLTLWPISDETTVQIMLDFYARALASGNAAQSLVDVQKEWLVKLRKEKGLFYAVNRAGPFIMSSQGSAEIVAPAQK